MTHVRARCGPWWPVGDFGFKGYHWCSNSQHCAVCPWQAAVYPWQAVGHLRTVLHREAPGAFRGMECLVSSEFIVLQRRDPTWIREAIKKRRWHSAVWNSVGRVRMQAQDPWDQSEKLLQEGQDLPWPGRAGEKTLREISQCELGSVHIHTLST